MGVKIRAITKDGQPYGWCVWCPACDLAHHFSDWVFNGDHEKPTFSPSMLVTWTYGEARTPKRCHSFLVDGIWQYLSDCTHDKAGQHVPAPDWPRPNWGSGS